MSKITFQHNQKILFIGDSITDAQRRETPYAPLGQGYVHFAANFLLAQHPELNLEIENRGISGDTTRALKCRWQRDCIDLNPDIVSIMIGINDLWRHFAPQIEMRRTAVPVEEYKQNLQWMMTEAKEKTGCRFILMEPFYFCDDPDDPLQYELPNFLNMVRNLAEDFDAVLVPIQKNYEEIKENVPETRWAWDRVHPYEWAHCWLAKQWLDAVL